MLTTHRRADGCGHPPTSQPPGTSVKTVKAETYKSPSNRSLCPSDLQRRPAPSVESGERQAGSVRNASTNKVQSRRSVEASQHEPDVGHRRPRAGRACVNPADVGPHSLRGRGYRASSGLNRAMEGGKTLIFSRTPVRRSGNVGRGWLGNGTCPISPKRGDAKSPSRRRVRTTLQVAPTAPTDGTTSPLPLGGRGLR